MGVIYKYIQFIQDCLNGTYNKYTTYNMTLKYNITPNYVIFDILCYCLCP
jgi:hypothetical protein